MDLLIFLLLLPLVLNGEQWINMTYFWARQLQCSSFLIRKWISLFLRIPLCQKILRIFSLVSCHDYVCRLFFTLQNDGSDLVELVPSAFIKDIQETMGNTETKVNFRKAVVQLTTKTGVS